MAGGAEGSGELRSDVVGNSAAESRGVVPVGGVAAVAIGVGAGQVVVVVGVAEGAGSRSVRASQREARCAVVESGIVPGGGVVALRAV